MNELMSIRGQNIAIKEYQGQRVVTFRDIDQVHGRPEGTARKRFNENRRHFIDGTDFFSITQPSEIRTLGIKRPQGGSTWKHNTSDRDRIPDAGQILYGRAGVGRAAGAGAELLPNERSGAEGPTPYRELWYEKSICDFKRKCCFDSTGGDV